MELYLLLGSLIAEAIVLKLGLTGAILNGKLNYYKKCSPHIARPDFSQTFPPNT